VGQRDSDIFEEILDFILEWPWVAASLGIAFGIVAVYLQWIHPVTFKGVHQIYPQPLFALPFWGLAFLLLFASLARYFRH